MQMKQFIVILCCFLWISLVNAQKQLALVSLQTNLQTQNQDVMESNQIVKQQITTYFDWRKQGDTISSIKDYGDCHLPELYADIAYYQSILYITYKKVYNLSEEYFVKCLNISCRSKETTDVIIWTTIQKCYAIQQGPIQSYDNEHIKFIKLQELHFGQTRIKVLEKYMEAIIRKYPVKALIQVTESFLNYKGGIHSYSQNDTIVFNGYSVQVVGYDNVNRYYIVKTALEKDWGENGFARIRMDTGKNCNILNYITNLSLVYYPKNGSTPKIHTSQMEQKECPEQNELSQQNISESNKTQQQNFQSRLTIISCMTGALLFLIN